jgi:hypothetical protein
MSRHVDKFERICGQMAHNNPTTPLTDENKIDWFLDSVTEKAYDSVHATCTDKLLEGDLTFAKVVKLYTHRCFQRYPHFQVGDIDKDNKPFTNNSTTFRRTKNEKGKGKPNKGAGRGRDQYQRHHDLRNRSGSTNKGKGKGTRSSSKGKGKRKSTSRITGNRQSKDPCSYCGGSNHEARTCYKRIEDEKSKTQKTHKQAIQHILIDESAMEFSQSVLSVITSDQPSPTPHTLTWGEDNNKEDDNTETNDSDEGKNELQDQTIEQREPNINEQQDEDKNEKLNLELTTSQNSSTEETMELAHEATWKEQAKNTDNEKENARFWKDLDEYEETLSDGKEKESDLSEEPKFTSTETKGDDDKESSSNPDSTIANKKET